MSTESKMPLRKLRLGLIGNPLGHSKSPEIHNFLTGTDYSLWPMPPEKLDEFFEKREFDGINVTIPYKLDVIKYLSKLDPAAERMGAVNTIVNRGGKLEGYNTDYLGLIHLIKSIGADLSGGKTAILGSGGASKAAVESVRSLGGSPVIVSRRASENTISYEQLYENEAEFTALINTTPVGMHPNVGALPVDLDRLPSLRAVVDIVANPLRTALVFEAEQRGLKTAGGLTMLVAQAHAADELFFDTKFDPSLIEKCVEEVSKQSDNIVLIGMPSSGKTTVGKLIAKKTGLKFLDMDEELVKRIGMPIAAYFKEHGEAAFRAEEAKLSAELSKASGLVISTGGGVIKNHANMMNLSCNGKVFWLKRDLRLLHGTADRPLSQNASDMEKLLKERLPLYEKYSDSIVINDGTAEEAAEKIVKLSGRA